MGNLANDLKMVKSELQGDIKNLLLQGDIKNIKKERFSFLLQTQLNKKHVQNLKSNNDSLVKMNAYYDKEKTGKLSFRKGEIVVVRRNPKATEPSNGRLYATTDELKAWRSWNENDDDSSENSDDEPGMQRPKRIVRKPVRYGDFMPGR
ncbi:hypothetical protein AVEN_49944-1 [Araneus ventricosus]|uniref:Uncharacterized protein n=1 Tax=Araneus ventricosus TaxID=182803 RepID=A0A4Y2EH97_ARAVE|nr:hypothetical protein AVEN_49944-1 [Araneus ventricosus]